MQGALDTRAKLASPARKEDEERDEKRLSKADRTARPTSSATFSTASVKTSNFQNAQNISGLPPESGPNSGHRGRLTSATNGHSRNSEAPLTPRKPSEFPCTSVRASTASQRARLRKKLRPYNAAEPRKSDRFPGVP